MGGEGWIKKQEWLENWVAKEEDALEMWYAKSSARNWSFSLSAAAKSLQSCPTLCDPIDGSPSGSPSLGFSRQEHWSGLPFPSPMHKSESEVAQSCLTLSDPMDCSLPGSSIHGIFQARILEWGAISFPMRSSQPRDWTQVSHIVGWCLPSEPPGKSLKHIEKG